MYCAVCNKSVKGLVGLSKHIVIHNMKAEEYTLKYLYNNIVPVCTCGCGKLTKYVRKSFKFNVYSRNHHPGNSTLGKKLNYTQEKLEEIKETRRQTCLDRYGVDSVMKVSLFSKKVFREGHNHPCWKGGTSSLVQMLRADYSLYKFSFLSAGIRTALLPAFIPPDFSIKPL